MIELLDLPSIKSVHLPIGDSPQLKTVMNGKYLIPLFVRSFRRYDKISDGVFDGDISVNFKSPLIVNENEIFATTCSSCSTFGQLLTFSVIFTIPDDGISLKKFNSFN